MQKLEIKQQQEAIEFQKEQERLAEMQNREPDNMNFNEIIREGDLETIHRTNKNKDSREESQSKYMSQRIKDYE